MIDINEDRKTAHQLLDQLLDQQENGDKVDTILWERLWLDGTDVFHRKVHRTRYSISIRIRQVE